MDDRRLLAALTVGDPRQLALAYQAFADPLYTYCRAMLGDPEPAAGALHDTFVVGSGLADRLASPARLRSWLYAIARNECLRRAPHGGSAAPVRAPEQVPTDRPVAAMSPESLHELVWAAAAALEPASWQLFELIGRHGLPTYEAGELAAVPVAHAPVRFARARAGLERAVGALLVIRGGQRDCPRLAEAFDGWDGRLTPATAERAIRHLDSCTPCAEGSWRRLPTVLVSAYQSAPFLPVPPMLWHRLELNCFDPGLATEREATVRRAGRTDPDTGFPLPVRRRQRRLVLTTAAAATAVLLAGGTGAWALAGDGPGEQAAAPSTGPEPAPTSAAAPEPTGNGPPSRVARGAAPVRPEPTPTPTPTPTATSPPIPGGPPPVLDVAVVPDCPFFGFGSYRLDATVIADQPLESAELHVVGESDSRSYELSVEGDRATARTDRLDDDEFSWWVVATGVEQQVTTTEPVSVADPCD